jgi:hypothetical protein
LFIYLVDVLVSNAKILYKESIGLGINEIDMVYFKEKLVMHMVGTRKVYIPNGVPVVHEIAPNTGKCICAYCALFEIGSRTRYTFSVCNIALCATGLHSNKKNCFALCHWSENIKMMCVRKY